MYRRQLLTASAAAGIAGVGTPSRAREDAEQDLVGSWYGTITATNPPLVAFNDLISFYVGGVVTETRRYLVPATPLGDPLETTGHGAWEQTGRNTFEAFFLFLLQNERDGYAIGTDNIHLRLTPGPGRGKLTGTFESQTKTTAETVLLEVTGTFSAIPITV
jgi:hypothetical protein